MNKRILLIEDNEDLRENTAELLELADYEVYTAPDGRAGVKLAKEYHPDLIICDIMMPELDGYGVLKMLSRSPETAPIPFIFLTAKADKADFRKGMNLGADDYLTKPFDESDLIDVIEMRLRKVEQLRNDFEPTSNGFEAFAQQAQHTDELIQLSEEKHLRSYKKKDIIYREGDHAPCIYLLHSGKLKASTEDLDAKEYITELVSPGEYFGYTDVLMQSERSHTITVMEDAEVYRISKDDFEQLLFRNKDVASRFIQLLAGSVQQKEERLLRLAFQSVRMRVRDALLLLRDKFKTEDQDRLTMKISRDDLASMVGTSTETVIRTLSDFKSEGMLEINRSEITISDEHALENMKF